MATLTGELISATYDSLLKVTDNNTITGIKKRITDGFGNDIPLLLSSTDLEIDGTFILSALTDLAPATKFLSLKADNSVGFRTSSELLSDIGGASSSSISGTTGRISKFTSTGAVGNSILNEIGNVIHLTDGTSSYASFGINNPGVDNDAYIGSTINNDFLIKVNNTEALRIDTAFRLTIANIQNAATDTDKFLVSDGGIVKYRTGTELRSDIGAGTVTSVGLTMPVAFSVANSPITSAGSLDVTAVGTASQYIRGDGQLATLPTGAGGGSAVNYYLNGSVAASVATYFQMSNSAVIGGGTDFNLVGNGLISQFLTDVGNPNRILIPGGAWNFEMFFSVSSAGGNQKFYIELLKYNGTTFTSIASGSTNPEEITGGTTTDLYLTSLAVPETVLLTTDRLAIRVYIVDNSGGRTVTLHTEDNNLCLVTTTFAGGISALNGLTANTQYLAVGTSGTDFNISSLLDTHTFNLPDASDTARGVITTGAQTIAGNKTFSNLRIENKGTSEPTIFVNTSGTSQSTFGFNTFGFNSDSNIYFSDGTGSNSGVLAFNNSINRTYTLPNATGTLALTSQLTGYVPYTGATGAVNLGAFDLTVNGLNIGQGAGNIITNTRVGYYALSDNTIGQYNTTLGFVSLRNNTTGSYNTAIGSGVLDDNTTGSYNTAIGSGVLSFNTIGIGNTALGTNALFYNTLGSGNIAIGNSAGSFIFNGTTQNTTSGDSIYLGNNTRPLANGNTNEIVIGQYATGGGSNSVTLGNSSIATTNLKGKVGIGYTTNPSLYDLDVNGTGRFAGNLITSAGAAINAGNGSFVISPSSTRGVINLGGTTDNFLTFANKAYIGVGSNYMQILAQTGVSLSLASDANTVLSFALSTGAATFSSLGTGTVYSNGGTLTNTNPSDANLKTEITDLSYGLNEIMQLRPVSYLWKDDKINQGKQFGFIAQEVQEIMPDLVKEGDYLGLDKEAIFVTLINAIKELNEKIIQLENK